MNSDQRTFKIEIDSTPRFDLNPKKPYIWRIFEISKYMSVLKTVQSSASLEDAYAESYACWCDAQEKSKDYKPKLMRFEDDNFQYVCCNCGYKFDVPTAFLEPHGFDEPPYETLYGCPKCHCGYKENDEEEDEEECIMA